MKVYVKSLRNKHQKPVVFTDASAVSIYLTGKNTNNYMVYIIENSKSKPVSVNTLNSQIA